MSRWLLIAILFLYAGIASIITMALTAAPAAAQGGGLQVAILRPGEGESYYAGPDSPRTAIYVLGRISSGDFDLDQIEVQLTVLHDEQQVATAQGAPNANGEFSFLVATNADGPEEVGRSSGNCYPCHGAAPVALPVGRSLLRVTATDPTGHVAVAERYVGMERPALATMPVRVSVKGQPEQTVSGVRVNATTGLYGWRARKFTGLTNGQGLANLQLEVLTQQPTRYRFTVSPTVVDGVLYQAKDPLELVLQPGTTLTRTIDLAVDAQLGRIAGTITPQGMAPGAPLTIRAVDLLSGQSFATQAADGRFAFAGIPLSRYLVTIDADQAAHLGYRTSGVPVDLTGQAQGSCRLALETAAGQTATGTVRDPMGAALPFAWIASADGKTAQPAAPVTGDFAWYGLPTGTRTLRVGAPGYWSRLIPAWQGRALAVTLRPKPGTFTVPWGSGQLVVPSDSLASLTTDRVVLQRGWLWGRGDQPLTIETAEATLRLPRGAFALEYLPGESAWLYLLEGEAQAGTEGQVGATLKAGEMIQFAGRDISQPRPVPMDEEAARLLQNQRPTPLQFEAEDGWWAWLPESLAQIGIGASGLAAAVGAATVTLLCAGGAALWLVRRSLRGPKRS